MGLWQGTEACRRGAGDWPARAGAAGWRSSKKGELPAAGSPFLIFWELEGPAAAWPSTSMPAAAPGEGRQGRVRAGKVG